VEEQKKIIDRYRKRTATYSLLESWVAMTIQERERAWLKLLTIHAPDGVQNWKALEIGCGNGDNLMFLMRLGMNPSNLLGNELLPERALAARSRLPAVISIWTGSADEVPGAEETLDLVVISMVLSSILDQDLRKAVCDRVWALLRPGGGILWYDFTVNNPRNPNVSGVTMGEVRSLFPESRIDGLRVTLAPPLSRVVCRAHPSLYTVFNVIPLLRTHMACWIGKPW